MGYSKKNKKKEAKKKSYSMNEIARIPELKNKLSHFSKLFLRKIKTDKDSIELVYTEVAKYLQVLYPVVSVYPELVKSKERKRFRTILEMIIAKSFNEIITASIEGLMRDELISEGILIKSEKGELEGTNAFIKGKKFIDWDKKFSNFSSQRVSFIVEIFKNEKAIINQILINLTDYKSIDDFPYMVEFSFMSRYFMDNGFEAIIKNRGNLLAEFNQEQVRAFSSERVAEVSKNLFDTRFKVSLPFEIRNRIESETIDEIENILLSATSKKRLTILLFNKDQRIVDVVEGISEKLSNKISIEINNMSTQANKAL